LSWFVLSFCGLVVTGLVVAWCWLGTPIPLAFFAKQPWYYGGFAGEFSWNPYYFLRVFLATALPFVLALIFFADRTDRRRALALLVPACLSMAVLFSFNQIMGHLGRFFFPFLPFFVAAGGLAARGWLVRRQQGLLPPGRTYFVRAALAGAVVLIGSNSLTLAGEGYAARAHEQILASLGGYHVPAPLSLPEVDSWQSAQIVAAIARSAPAGTSIAMSEHGLPSALAPNVAILDVLGLHDRNFAQHGFSASELFRRKPDAIWMPHPDHTQMLRDILDSDDFWREYVFYPDAFTYGFALRRTGPRFANLLALLTHAWSATYPGVPMAQHVAQRGE
jgi:hypothetical protein